MVQLVEIEMSDASHLCVFHLATAGLPGVNLGSDEEETVALMYVIIDKAQRKVIGVQQYIVKPSIADSSDTFLSAEVTFGNSLTEDLVRKGLPLDIVISQFDSYLRTLKIDRTQIQLVTDGELPLRQCLHPEACYKKIDLPEYYNSFSDLRKDFKTFYSTQDDVRCVAEMVDYLSMPSEVDPDYCLREVKDMVNLTLRLLSDGYRFSNLETVMINLEPGLCSKNEEVDPNCVVRARGLPWQSSDGDIAKFFRGLNIEKGGVALCLSPLGRRNGEALVRFVNQAHRDMALRRHKHHMGSRYIEVYKSTGEEFVNVAGGNNSEAHDFLSRGGQVIIRMRGLPYDCTAAQVLEFFRTGVNRCEVLDGEDGVLFVKKADGRATGDAFVLFAHESDAPVALSKHRELIGSRYIELFRSTTAEVQQVLNRTSHDVKAYKVPVPVVPSLPAPPLLPQHVITCGTRKDCIRLRGLPYEAQVEHILEFLGDYAKNIVYQGVHMVYNSQGQPSGEAFIQMDSETSAFHAATNRHHQTMTFGKKQRYVEVFQCSGDDMNSILTGGQVSPKATPVLSAACQSRMCGIGCYPPGVGRSTCLCSLCTYPELVFNSGRDKYKKQYQRGGTLVPGPSPPYGGPFAPFPPNTQLIASAMGPGLPPRGPPQYGPYGSVYIWSYPSPPVSPTGYFGPPGPQPLAIIPPEWAMDFGPSPPQIPQMINTQQMGLQGIHSVVA